MPVKKTDETQCAYFRGLVAAGAKYIDPEDLRSGLSYKLFDTPQGGRPDKCIEGMVRVYFEGHEFLCPIPPRRGNRKTRRPQPR